MNTLNKFQSLFLFIAIVIGLFLGRFPAIAAISHSFILPFLILMLFGLFLHIPLNQLLKSFSNLRFLCANLSINFLWTPLFAFLLGTLFFHNQVALSIGLMMLLVTPCTDWYLIFTSIAKGNVSLSASVLPLNLILQILLLPFYLFLFYGRSGSVDFSLFFRSISLVILFPFLLSLLIKFIFLNRGRCPSFTSKLFSFFDSGQLFFLSLAIVAMFASMGQYLIDNYYLVLIILIPLLLFFTVNFFLSRLVASLLGFSYADSVSLNLVTLARNSPISLALAVTMFPSEPLIPLVLVIAPLIELPVLGIVSQILLRIKMR